MEDIHDRGYAKLFSNLEIFRQLVTTFVHEPWVKDLDFSRCELMKESFISKEYKRTFSDLVYKIKLRGRDLYIVVLLEFKATLERFVGLQILGYIVDFYWHLLDSRKRLRKLPPVFPIMLYRGERRWTVPVDLASLIEGNEL
jgi:predicted transposase/invertase (TIGR01784 family)